MDPSKFYYAGGNCKAVGPVSLNELRSLAAEGMIRTSAPVISEDGQQWESFAEIERRFGGESSAQPVHIAVRRGNQTFGPYTIPQTKEYLSEGRLRPTDLPAMEGLGQWKPLAKEWVSAEGLFSRLLAEGVDWKDIHATTDACDSLKCSLSATAIATHLFYCFGWQFHTYGGLRLIRQALGKLKRSLLRRFHGTMNACSR